MAAIVVMGAASRTGNATAMGATASVGAAPMNTMAAAVTIEGGPLESASSPGATVSDLAEDHTLSAQVSMGFKVEMKSYTSIVL